MYKSREIFKKRKKRFRKLKSFFCEKNYNAGTLISKNRKILLEADQKSKKWKEHLEELYEDNLNTVSEEKDQEIISFMQNLIMQLTY